MSPVVQYSPTILLVEGCYALSDRETHACQERIPHQLATLTYNRAAPDSSLEVERLWILLLFLHQPGDHLLIAYALGTQAAETAQGKVSFVP
jgi:hypothetical protein